MTRAHRILSKADRDGTTRHITPALERPDFERLSDRRSRFAWNPGDDVATALVEPMAPASPREPVAPSGVRPVFGATLDKDMVAALAPFSPAAEQYRSLRTRIAQIETAGQRRVILVSSPGEGDGKTITAANLALTMAQEFQRQVLIVDADLRDARLHECLGIPREPGLADVLAGQASLDDALVSLSEYRVIALPAGTPHARPAELLGSEPMRRLMEDVSRRFDRVVVDSTAAHFADAGVLEPLADGVLLVVRAGRTTRPSIGRALGLVPRAKLLGLVLNDSRASAR
jgi:capsular exopolysaccharide synthesis family protein